MLPWRTRRGFFAWLGFTAVLYGLVDSALFEEAPFSIREVVAAAVWVFLVGALAAFMWLVATSVNKTGRLRR